MGFFIYDFISSLCSFVRYVLISLASDFFMFFLYLLFAFVSSFLCMYLLVRHIVIDLCASLWFLYVDRLYLFLCVVIFFLALLMS